MTAPAPPAAGGDAADLTGQELVARIHAGDAALFDELYRRYCNVVYRFVYFRVGHRQHAEDLTQDTFLRAMRRFDRFQWQGKDVGAWLVTIARNLVADHFKSARVRLDILTPDMSAETQDASPLGNAEDETVTYLMDYDLMSILKQLNPEQHEVLVLRFLKQMPVSETAQVMGKQEGAIKALQYRAVRSMARLIAQSGWPE